MRTDLDMAGLKEKGKKDIGKELDGMKMRKRWERWKRVGCLALAFMTAAAVFGGCSKGTGERRAEESDGAGGGSGLGDASQEEEQDRGSGRFVETERTLPEGVESLLATERGSDGSVYGFGHDGQFLAYYLLRTADGGETWDTTKVQELGAVYLSRVAVSPEGGAAAFGYYTQDAQVGLKVIGPDGSVREVPLQMPAYEGDGDSRNQITQAKYTADGQLLAVDLNSNLYRVDLENGNMEQVNASLAGIVGYVDTAGKWILAVTDEGVQCLDSATGDLLSDHEPLKATTDSSKMLGTDGNYFPVVYDGGATEGSVIYVNHQGLFYLGEGAAVSEQLINGEQVSLGDESTLFSAVYTLGQESYLVFGADSLGINRCYYYQYDAQASAVPTKQLNIYALEDSNVLQQVISYYKKENQDVFVKKTIGIQAGSGMTAEDALRALNTELLAGNGPDILILDGMPVESYQEKGVLTDLGGYLEAAETADGLFTNIMENFYNEDGKICQIPLRFFFYVVEGDGDALAAGKSLESLADYAVSLGEKNPGKQVLSNTTARNFLENLYYADSAGWRGSDGSVEEEALRGFLQAAEKMYGLDSHDNVTESMGRCMSGGQLYGTAVFAANGRHAGSSFVSFGSLDEAESMQNLFGIQKQIGGSTALLNTDAGNAFVPYVSLGLTGKGAENPSAQRFVETALSKACQSVISDGFPVNRSTYQDNFSRMKGYGVAMSGPNDEVIGYEMEPLNEAQQQALTGMIESLKEPAMTDRVILELVLAEGEACLKGNQTVDQAVANIMQKIRLYQAE